MENTNSIRIQNPVLPGFHPDPSICRAGEDFYIATSTFEYYPGVAIHHSRNLQDWELISHALTESRLLEMTGNPQSGGVWAPCLSYSEGLFYLIFTDVKDWFGARQNGQEGFKDAHNYLVTAEDINGPWSDPVFLNSSGFDPSLFHDDDGRKWLVNQLWDYRPGRNSFAGILLQEYSPEEKALVGPVRNIFTGSYLKCTEAPHIYKRNGWYYLMTAEGGTSYFHAVTMARSRTLEGPYEMHPQTHLLTAVKDYGKAKELEETGQLNRGLEYFHGGLQKAGHGSMVPWTDDEWILAHLCGRPVDESLYCPLGRETALQRVIWNKDGWPYVQGAGASVEVDFSRRENLQERTVPRQRLAGAPLWREDFNGSKWDPALNTLRRPADNHYDLKERPGWLRLYGQESPGSRFRQSVLVRRVQHHNWSAGTQMDFSPENFQQMAGLIVRYDETTQVIFRVSDRDGKRTLGLIQYDLKAFYLPLGEEEVELAPGPVELAVDVEGRTMQFRYRERGGSWIKVNPVFDAGKLSDDYVEPMGFTGTYAGLCSFDVSGSRAFADFDYLEYKGEAKWTSVM